MGRSSPAFGHSIGPKHVSARSDERRIEEVEGNIVVKKERNQFSFLLPFLLGAVIGGIGGAIFGTLMAPYFSAIKSLGGKLLRRGDADQPKFELLLQ